MLGIRLAICLILSTLISISVGEKAGRKEFLGVLEQYDIHNDLTTFRGLVKLLVPNNKAFDKLGGRKALEEHKKRDIQALLRYHILAEPIVAALLPVGELTVPTLLDNTAYAKVTGGQQMLIAKYVDGEVVFISGSGTRGSVQGPGGEDVLFGNGTIQVIDSVMQIPKSLEATAWDDYPEQLTSFVEALKTTDDQLVAVCRYHIVPRRVLHTWELADGMAVETLQSNRALTFTKHDNTIYANSAKLLAPLADILLSTGLVHVISNVLNPEDPDARPDPTNRNGVQPDVFPKTSTGTTYRPPRPTKEADSAARMTGAIGFGLGLGLAMLGFGF
ncbi:hypothetical protein QBC47DRAFT_455980 [Echria macrotheca]|uniref:FAS1 domain-containing protein n=1 Tax=Echria macrotheca TaxID=438768 RepID=A0AAJ0FAJ8_9PEZI|nr:hypothetical protein QBC47DRAFT_455980 [Echria macrotheca]